MSDGPRRVWIFQQVGMTGAVDLRDKRRLKPSMNCSTFAAVSTKCFASEGSIVGYRHPAILTDRPEPHLIVRVVRKVVHVSVDRKTTGGEDFGEASS
jgi:hypothetical protein